MGFDLVPVVLLQLVLTTCSWLSLGKSSDAQRLMRAYYWLRAPFTAIWH